LKSFTTTPLDGSSFEDLLDTANGFLQEKYFETRASMDEAYLCKAVENRSAENPSSRDCLHFHVEEFHNNSS
jgi:hypothetical protein